MHTKRYSSKKIVRKSIENKTQYIALLLISFKKASKDIHTGTYISIHFSKLEKPVY